MASKLITTHELSGKRVIETKKKTKRIGKVRCCVFHPTEKRCVGFIVKRPDLLLMFHRKDLFVSIRGYDLEDGRIAIRDEPGATGQAACKELGVNWDDCVLWEGLPVMCEDGTSFGYVGNITFDRRTGAIESFETDSGVAQNALLGKMTIPADYIRGFRRGMGTALTRTDVPEQEGAEPELGALLVSDEVKQLNTEGGAAEKAGQATAVVVSKVKPAASDAAHAAGEAVNKGAYATGKQLGKAKTMFSDFKEEYDKARHEGEEPGAAVAGELDAAGEAGADEVLQAEPVKKPAASTSSTSTKKKSTKSSASYKVGKHLSSASTMFSDFKKEYDKARHDD